MIEAIYSEIADTVENDCWIDWSGEPKTIQLPVMIWDVLDWIEKQDNWEYIDNVEVINIWKNKKLSIEEQSDECIKYIYNLLQDGHN